MNTKTIRVVTRRERIKRLLVWHPINTDPADDDRWTVRVWLPLYDILVIISGLIAYIIGSPTLNRLFPEVLVDSSAIAFGLIGFVTLVGVIIPRLWRVEAIGKISISFMLTTYAFLVLAYPSRDAQTNAFITVILIMATWGIYPRLTRLFIHGIKESAERKAARKGYDGDSR